MGDQIETENKILNNIKIYQTKADDFADKINLMIKEYGKENNITCLLSIEQNTLKIGVCADIEQLR